MSFYVIHLNILSLLHYGHHFHMMNEVHSYECSSIIHNHFLVHLKLTINSFLNNFNSFLVGP
jgi:hypothetical protein